MAAIVHADKKAIIVCKPHDLVRIRMRAGRGGELKGKKTDYGQQRPRSGEGHIQLLDALILSDDRSVRLYLNRRTSWPASFWGSVAVARRKSSKIEMGLCCRYREFHDMKRLIDTGGDSGRQIRQPLGETALFDYAVGALARRMRTERELRRLMGIRAEPGEEGVRAMDAVVGRLKEMNYLSDARFAADYTRLRKENEKLGRRRVQQDLAAKGISSQLVAASIGAAYEDVDEEALARAYIARKRMKAPAGPDSKKQAARAMGRLLRAGFSSAAVFKVLRAWGVEAEEGDLDDSGSLEDADRE
jgi:regulatory protein